MEKLNLNEMRMIKGGSDQNCKDHYEAGNIGYIQYKICLWLGRFVE